MAYVRKSEYGRGKQRHRRKDLLENDSNDRAGGIEE